MYQKCILVGYQTLKDTFNILCTEVVTLEEIGIKAKSFPPKPYPAFPLFVSQTVEKFFSKEIKYLVSNKREARYVQCLRQDSPVPSPDSGPSSPHPRSNPHRPGSRGDNIKSRSQGQTDTVSSLSLFDQPDCGFLFPSRYFY